MDGAIERLHATAIAVGQRAIIIRGPSGSGKSDLALRCLAVSASPLVPQSVRLIADDQVILERRDGEIFVAGPASIRGQLEVRGVGIIDVPAAGPAKLVLVADLVAPQGYERLPDPGRRVTLLGLALPAVEISPFEGSAALKLLMALTLAGHAGDKA